MRALLSSIEKYKPNMVKVARWVRHHSIVLCPSKQDQGASSHRTLSQAIGPEPGMLWFDHPDKELIWLLAWEREGGEEGP